MLDSLKLERLHNPDGYLKIDEHTLVFVISPGEVCIIQVIADIAEPAMIFHDKIEKQGWEDYKTIVANEQQENPRARLRKEELLTKYDEHDIPDSDDFLRQEGLSRCPYVLK
ncbi:hypothetical protein TSTA_021080 [Talaromyces stipitatus ATCC 10500]|uniref:Uncharacterized protein n=1 Tax=Talaromyces stipitatus (strain ATCC 10500 / CBS 375.48 / QM 6759 / NRRL 1006) TaxID=441959 RepID=B8MFQ7_TALSN|nr:uncharacterized protein TSTA_021080 [Talaromyces stipitatus ATCC 10500]EED17047.1 hypothetical protein TSTA_021080 [Talaromyces stipitatus ATCC 10500]